MQVKNVTISIPQNNLKENILSEDLRNKMIERTEVLDKVKKLFLIPEMEVMTTKMVADYYEVELSTLQKCYQRNKNEIQSDGIVHKKISDFLALKSEMDQMSTSLEKVHPFLILKHKDYTVKISNAGALCFSKRAVLRIGMLLTESKIAQEVRTQLLNIVEKTDNATKVEEINKEQEICNKIGIAFLSGDINKIMLATTEAMDYKNRYINKLENEKVELSKINDNLKTENDLLTKQNLIWDNKAILNALIRKLSFVKDCGVFGNTWNSFYKDVKYKFGYDIKSREGKGAYINKIKEKEFPNIISLAVSLCKENNIDVNKVIGEMNSNASEGSKVM